MILCKHCHLPKPELQFLAEMKGLKRYEKAWLCEECSNVYHMMASAPEPERPQRCIKCGRIIRIAHRGNRGVCWRCINYGDATRNRKVYKP